MSRWHKTDWDLLPENAFQPRLGKFGGMTLEGGKGSAPKPPDYRPLAEASEKVGMRFADLAEEQFNFGKALYEENKPLFQQAAANNLEGQQIALDIARMTAADRARYQGLEQSLIDDANRYSADQLADRFATRAQGDTQQALANARDQQLRNLARIGVNPNSGRFAALNNQLSLQGAAMEAGNMNMARMAGEDAAFNRRQAVAAIGRNLPSTTFAGISTGANASQVATNQLNQSAQPFFQGGSAAMQGYSGANSAYGTSANMLNMGYQNQMAQYNANQQADSGFGQLLGTAAGYYFGGPSGAQAGASIGGMFADGGQVRDVRGATDRNEDGNGGKLSGPGTGTSDSIRAINTSTGDPIRLSNGEYIIPADVVRKKGKAFFDQMVDKHHKPVRSSAIRRS